MPITINTNVAALSAQRNLEAASMRSQSSLTKLASGSRVPTAKEDAAALSIGTGLQLDVTALRAAQSNAAQGTSLLQIADGAFGEISNILDRMKSLSTTAQSEQLSTAELGFLNQEFGLLRNEIDRIAGTTEFNGISLLGGSSTVVLDAAAFAGATAVDTDQGFVAFEFDDSSVAAGDVFEIAFDQASNELTLGKLVGASGTNVESAQTITVASPSAGETTVVDFNDLGVKITLNSDFDDTADINVGFSGGGATFEITAAAGTAAVQADLDFQVGIGNGGVAGGDAINIQVALGSYQELVGAGTTLVGVDSQANAQTATAQVDTAVDAVNTARASIGSTLNRLEFAQSNLAVTIENTEAARSTLMDVDVSAEMTKFSSEQVLIQAGVSMLAQANQQPSLLLRLLQ